MKTTLLLAAASLASLVGCASPSTSAEPAEEPSVEEELKSSECPAKVEVSIAKPSIPTDATLTHAWESDFTTDYGGNPPQEARDQLGQLTTHLAKARAEDVVKLTGTLGQRCFYATVDAATGRASEYHIWFAKTSGPRGGLQLRISRDFARDESIFFNAPVKTLSATALAMDTAKDARVYAQHHETGYHGEPEGLNVWIGSAKVSAKIAH